MNLLLLEPEEVGVPLPLEDPRVVHLRQVLRLGVGDRCEVGVVNAARGHATLRRIDAAGVHLDYVWSGHAAHSTRHLIVGHARPQTARDILRDATTLGAGRIDFVFTARSDPNYAASKLWTGGEWRRHLRTGAAQACDPAIPEVGFDRPLAAVLAELPATAARLALDVYEGEAHLAARLPDATQPIVLALGPERGWDAADRTHLRAAGFTLVHLGPRVLRVETAVVAALSLLPPT
jgi:16S rRNA (uracil1498-N3)-methyltransferase